ncbi:MAG: circularly permuted type 2 ATP-grasp protein, partial [Polymorphobacter sp.]
MIAPRAAVVSGLLAMLGGCVDYGVQGYSAVPVAGAPPYGPGNAPSLDQFTAALAPFGRWVQSPQYGNAWQPQVGPGWQPYTVGRWLDDPNYGRTWLGDEPWSWATDHYGRWGFDTQLGWVWVPGTTWAPAWVAWRDGNDVAGWAPLPPVIGNGFAYGAALGALAYDSWGYDQWYAPSWVFVPRGAVHAPYRQRQRLPYGRDRDDWNATRPVNPGQHSGQYGGQHGGYQGSIVRDGNAFTAPPPRRGNTMGGTGARPGTPGDSAGANAAPSRPPRGTAGQSSGVGPGGGGGYAGVVQPPPSAPAAAPRPAPAPAAEAAPAPRPGPGHELSPTQPESAGAPARRPGGPAPQSCARRCKGACALLSHCTIWRRHRCGAMGICLAQTPAFDEMFGFEAAELAAARAVRPAYQPLRHWLEGSPRELMETRRRQAELFFRRIGITFAVYGDPDAAERLIPFDIVPRILAREEWTALEAGLKQRVGALNAFLADIYGAREILRAGIVPEELVLLNPAYAISQIGKRPVGDIWVHIAGIDMVRTDSNQFFVLEDNARTPSGVSYMLENREVMLKLVPELFASLHVAPVETYPEKLLQTLRSV